LDHQAGEGNEMQATDRFWQPFIVPRQSVEACQPGKTVFHDPPPGQQHEARLRFTQLHHLQRDAMRCGRISSGPSGVAIIDKSELDLLSGRRLHRLRQHLHLAHSCLLAGVTWTASK